MTEVHSLIDSFICRLGNKRKFSANIVFTLRREMDRAVVNSSVAQYPTDQHKSSGSAYSRQTSSKSVISPRG